MPYIESSVRRVQIVAAARRAMERSGVASTSMREIAVEAGVPLGTLQHVFPAKELLLRAVFDDVIQEMAALEGRDGLELDDGVDVAVRSALRTFWSGLVHGREHAQLMQLELLAYAVRTSPGALAPVLYEQYIGVAAAVCRQAAERSGERLSIADDQLARLLVAGLDGLLVQHLADPDEARSSADLDVLAAMVVHAAGVGPATA